ncbi:MAG: DeoR/GlpR family DNA-binding transcription regulator [Pelolinea sp.]|nr:DeoR/GlpR family DNA-binding transcription regulator [Pelolinea sp.]
MGRAIDVKKRQAKISEYVLANGFASVEDLMALLKISRMTVHRDLDDLERSQLIQKVRRGASAQPSSIFESDFGYRERVNALQKEALCKAAATFLSDGMSIFLDDSTTVIPLIKHFPDFKSLTVITSCLPSINEISKIPGINLIILGGEYKSKYRSAYGYFCISTINKIHADLAVLSPHSFRSGSVFEYEQQVISVKRAMMDNSEKKMILMDNSKFKQTTLYLLAKINEFDHVIIDNLVPRKIIEELKTQSKGLIIVKP